MRCQDHVRGVYPLAGPLSCTTSCCLWEYTALWLEFGKKDDGRLPQFEEEITLCKQSQRRERQRATWPRLSRPENACYCLSMWSATSILGAFFGMNLD